MNPNTRFIVACITFLGFIGGALGFGLVIIGYHGDMLLMCMSSAISGLLGMLAQKSPTTPSSPSNIESQTVINQPQITPTPDK